MAFFNYKKTRANLIRKGKIKPDSIEWPKDLSDQANLWKNRWNVSGKGTPAQYEKIWWDYH
jgi:hypothetical protein